uniref:Uncharacterized protein n=1 Tax=Pristionchus pacificus TaxID=54126 RepID=A0A2A6BVJ9_PRIPA|eukprot:PDM69887.1 hypothetical protein PRIPAC_49099 [Pristionchus pacificus]
MWRDRFKGAKRVRAGEKKWSESDRRMSEQLSTLAQQDKNREMVQGREWRLSTGERSSVGCPLLNVENKERCEQGESGSQLIWKQKKQNEK